MSRRRSISDNQRFSHGKLKETSVIHEEVLEKPIPVDYKKELIFYFYNAMLDSIVQEWESNVEDTTESLPSGDEVISSRPYKPHAEVTVEEVGEEEINNDSPSVAQKRNDRKSAGKIRESIMEHRTTVVDTIKTDSRKPKKGLHRGSYTKLRMKKHKSLTLRNSIKAEKDDWILISENETAKIMFLNGNRYVGELYKKIMHGTGQFTWADGTTYTGDFKNGEMTGKGRIEFTDKSVYEGEVYKGYIHGYGNERKNVKFSFYNGEYYLGSKHGKGRMHFGQNNYYEGPWNMNKREGTGFRYYAEGTKYYGDWINGIRHGLGSVVFKNNDFYQGEWLNGEKCGYGEYVWNAFLNNVFSIPVQNKYCGLWEHDLMHGFGLLYFGTQGGARYAGTFFRNIKHGAGIVVCNNGNVIKADPLFINDKAVSKLKKSEKCRSSRRNSSSYTDSENSEANQCNYSTCSNLEPRVYPILPEQKLKQQDFSKITNFVFPCFGYERNTVAYIDRCTLMYSNDLNIECVSMSIDLSSYELIDLKKIINKVALKYLYVIKNINNKENTSSIKEKYFKELKIWPCLLPEHFWEENVFDRFNKYKECDNFFVFEEERMRKAIRVNLHYLLDLYNHYAFVACVHEIPKLTYKPWMMRICLWQLFIDCKMPYKNVSLNEIDEMLAEYSSTTVADIHNPFDVIYFWQFLTAFVILSWKIYGNDFTNIKTNGILEKAFIKFLTNDIFPNAKKHTGCALFDYKDIIPITSAFEWYKSFGPNFTVYDFLKYSSSLHRSLPPGYYQEIGINIPKIKYGQNIAFISDKIIYREVKAFVIGDKKYDYPVVYAHTHGYYLKSLKYLFLLGGRRVLTILKEVCPMIMAEDEFVNLNHVLSFLEFYEVVLKCTEEKVNQDEKVKTRESIYVKPRKTAFHFAVPSCVKLKPRKSTRRKIALSKKKDFFTL